MAGGGHTDRPILYYGQGAPIDRALDPGQEWTMPESINRRRFLKQSALASTAALA
ncbi:MAG TPA: twin-arginine translocation signal domain-containing protein, partial [Phycisphaerales bacterium]|nr:twin-arginine translocation signal domain-containing protein [Phycisphaerales bacterium]